MGVLSRCSKLQLGTEFTGVTDLAWMSDGAGLVALCTVGYTEASSRKAVWCKLDLYTRAMVSHVQLERNCCTPIFPATVIL